MKPLVRFLTKEEQILKLNENAIIYRGTLCIPMIADIHFGVIDPKDQYEILKEQFLLDITKYNFDAIAICGDLFDHKVMANNDAALYATLFIEDCVNLCRMKGATLIILAGTLEHDANQLKLFYKYLSDPTIDIRIVEEVKFEYIKGAKVLCIPELYGRGRLYYENFFYRNGYYDMALVHGTFVNSIYGCNQPDLDTSKSPIFCLEHFGLCRGPILSGHVHISNCFESYYYYSGSPIQTRFGEEQQKGYLVLLYNLDTSEHYVQFNPIHSFIYKTINIDDIIKNDIDTVVKYVKTLKEEQGIDFIRLRFSVNSDTIPLLKNYFRGSRSVFLLDEIQKQMLKANEEELAKYNQYDYIFDKNLTEVDIFCRYVNDQIGETFITSEELVKLLEEVI